MFTRQPQNAPYAAPIRRHSFFSALAWGGSATLIALIASVTILAKSGLGMIDRKSDDVLGFVHTALESLPELVESLPPAIGDALNDERRADYAPSLQVAARLTDVDANGWVRPSIEITNSGDRIVSMLSMRVVLLSPDGHVLAERNVWAATPIAADDDWRGPLQPGNTRRLSEGFYVSRGLRNLDKVDVAVELTDVRVWRGPVSHSAERPAESDVRVASSQP